jgi:hypothetical protein
MLCGKCLCIICSSKDFVGDEKAWPHLIVVSVVWLVFSDILLQLNLSGEMAGITGVDQHHATLWRPRLLIDTKIKRGSPR